MALSPAGVAVLSAADVAAVREFEQKIDDKLQSDYVGRKVIVAFGNYVPTYKQSLELVNLYRAAGWKKVDFKNDTLAGSYLEIE